MRRMVAIKDMSRGDIFELSNGSVYEATGITDQSGVYQARLWCAHDPDASTFEPPATEFPPDQQVQMLDGHDMKTHSGHMGYVKTLFNHEMDRRNNVMMQSVYQRGQQATNGQQQQEHARRPWWKKVFGVGA